MSKIKEIISMATEILKLTAEIVVSHASMSELSPQQLVEEIKEVYNALSRLEGGEVISEPVAVEIAPEAEVVKTPPIPLKDIVKEKYVVCLECGKKMRTLKAHLRKAHGLKPKEYAQRYGLDLKRYPLTCKQYSAQRSQLAKSRNFGVKGTHHKATA
jgi:predicted transcriptional regulator